MLTLKLLLQREKKNKDLNGGPGDVVPGVSTFPAMINVMVMTINEKEPAIETT